MKSENTKKKAELMKTMKNRKLIKKQKSKRNQKQTTKKSIKKTINKNTSKSQAIIKALLKLHTQIKFLHWNTKKYAVHMISDKFHKILSGHIDELVEVLLAQDVKLHAVPKYYENIADLSTPLTTYEIEKENTLNALKQTINTINTHSQDLTRDVNAILDVVITDINRFKYLLSLK